MSYEYNSRRRLLKQYKYLDEEFIKNFQKIKVSTICKDLGFRYDTTISDCSPERLRMIRLEIERRIRLLYKYSDKIEQSLKESE